MTLTCGVDSAESHHDIALIDDNGSQIAHERIDTGAAGFTRLLTLIAEHRGTAQNTPIAIETDKNLLVVAAAEAGITVYPINPRAVARYRERHSQAGRKSDAGDAAVLGHILRADRHIHRPLSALSEQARAIRALARQHQEAIWAPQQTVSRFRSVLLEFYPQALQRFPNLQLLSSLAILAVAPSPTKARNLTRRRVVAMFKQCGRCNDAAAVDHIVATLKADALGQPQPIEDCRSPPFIKGRAACTAHPESLQNCAHRASW